MTSSEDGLSPDRTNADASRTVQVALFVLVAGVSMRIVAELVLLVVSR